MATVADGAPMPRTRVSKRAERIFYTSYMIAAVAIIFAGFAPSFYLRGVVTPAAPIAALRPDMIVHGTLASVFMLGFPLQAWLIAQRRQKLHMSLGKWLFAIGALLVPLGYWVGSHSYHAPTAAPMDDAQAAMFMAFPLFGTLFIAATLAIGWRYRFEAQTHKRLMVAFACGMTDPAIFRMPIWTPTLEGILFVQGVMLATLLPLVAWDLVTTRRVHKGTLIGAALFVGECVLRTVIMPTAGWAALVHALPGFGVR